jgi:tRNA(fMet)-specific endonuclease VapC
MRYLLDTNICIAAMKGNAKVRMALQKHSPHDLGVSMVTWFELWTGVQLCRDPMREARKLHIFVSPLHLLVMDELSARTAAEIRADLQAKGTAIGPYDLLIAGHAKAMEAVLVTNNIREFKRVPGLEIEDWSQ